MITKERLQQLVDSMPDHKGNPTILHPTLPIVECGNFCFIISGTGIPRTGEEMQYIKTKGLQIIDDLSIGNRVKERRLCDYIVGLFDAAHVEGADMLDLKKLRMRDWKIQ